MAKNIFDSIGDAVRERFIEDANDLKDLITKSFLERKASTNSHPDYLQEGYRPNRRDRLSQPPVSHRTKDDAFLCLIVPTNRIDQSLRQVLFFDNKLTVDNTKLLIDKSAYFITCSYLDLDGYIRDLNLSKEPIDYSLNGDVYIQLFIPRGEDTINNDLKRMLLRNLPDNNAVVEEVYLLNAITRNIDRFHRA